MNVTGSLYTKNGIYQMMIRVRDENGNSKQKSKSTGIKINCKNGRENRANKIKADRMLAEYIAEQSKCYTYGGDKDVLLCIDSWLLRKREEVRQDTFESYRFNFEKHIKPYFAMKHLRMGDVTPRDIRNYVESKRREGQSSRSIRKHLVILNGVFKDAVSLGEIPSNPCAGVSVKSGSETKYEGTAYDSDQARQLLTAVAGDPIETAVYLGLYLGLRRSEVAGLRWKDIDFEHSIVHIRNTVVRMSSVSELEKTKSKASRRDLYMPNSLASYLQAKQAERETTFKLLNRDTSGDDHVCSWPDGRQYEPTYISVRFKKVLNKIGLPVIRFHDLRHTAGSLLINDGHTVKQVQEFLGHENASTTLDIYSHVSVDGKKNTAQKLDELLAV